MSKSTCSLCRLWQSSIGKKIVVALTGIILVGFLLGHLSGNLLIFAGPEAFNEYAAFLHGMLHGVGIWIARIVLLACLVLHVTATVQLVKANKVAKGGGYNKEHTNRASKSSRMMIWSGLTILAFVIYHILHYTVRINQELKDLALSDKPGEGPYGMVIKGFQDYPTSIFYIIAISLLCSHLSHGIASIFQTLGLRTRKNAGMIDTVAKGLTAVIWIGFLSIPVAVMAGFVCGC